MRDWLERIALEQERPRYPWGSLKQVLGAREQGCPLGQYPRLVGTLGLEAMREHPPEVPETLCHPAPDCLWCPVGILVDFLPRCDSHNIHLTTVVSLTQHTLYHCVYSFYFIYFLK